MDEWLPMAMRRRTASRVGRSGSNTFTAQPAHMSIREPTLLTTVGRRAPTPGFLAEVLQNLAGGTQSSPPPLQTPRGGGRPMPRVQRLQHLATRFPRNFESESFGCSFRGTLQMGHPWGGMI